LGTVVQLTPEIKSWIGRSTDPVRVRVCRRDICKYAAATGQRLSRYINGDEAPPLFHFGLFRRIVPLDQLRADGLAVDDLLPPVPLQHVLFGGQQITYHKPICPGDVLVGTRTVRDIFVKTGASGSLVFVVLGLEVVTETGEPVLNEDATYILH